MLPSGSSSLRFLFPFAEFRLLIVMSQELQIGCMHCGPCKHSRLAKLQKSRSESLRLSLSGKLRKLAKWHVAKRLNGLKDAQAEQVKRGVYDVLDTAFEFLRAEGDALGVEIDKELRGVMLKWGAQHGLFHPQNGDAVISDVKNEQ